MSSATHFRLSGLALLVAVALQVMGWAIHPPGEEIDHLHSAGHIPSHAIMFFSWVLVMLGLMGVYLRQAGRVGRLGLVSFVLLMTAIAYHFYLLLFESVVAPVLADEPAAHHLILDGGPLVHGGTVFEIFTLPIFLAFVLFGIVTLRARVLPRASGWLQIASAPMLILASILIEAGPLSVLGSYGGTIPIAFFYYAIFAGYAVAGYALWSEKSSVREVEARVAPVKATA